MQKVHSDHRSYTLKLDLGEAAGNNRAAVLELVERLRWEFPQVSKALQRECVEATDALIADLYSHLRSFPRTFEPHLRKSAPSPVCAHCGEPLESVSKSRGPQYHGRCLREASRLAMVDLEDPESIG